jgi:hypothetical protein
MNQPGAALIAASLGFVLFHYAPATAQAPLRGDIRVRVVRLLKQSYFEGRVGDGPVLLGPQAALELEWSLFNDTSGPLEITSPDILRPRVSLGGRIVRVRTKWGRTVQLRTGTGNHTLVSDPLPVGAITLPNGSSFSLRGSTETLDGSPFSVGDYVIWPDVDLPNAFAGGVPSTAWVDPGYPIQLHIVAVNSPLRWRLFHMIEGAFCRDVDPERALEHYKALAVLPGAEWGGSLALAETYAGLGRHREACAVFRKIMPDLIRLPDSPLAKYERQILIHLRAAAWSFAVEGDTATATYLLRLEGRTPADRIPAEIDRLRKPR